jgi:hypothetical protein
MVEPPRRGMGGGGEVDRLCPKRGACRRPASPSGSPTAIGLVFGLSKRTRAKGQGDELFSPCSESLPTNQRARQTRGHDKPEDALISSCGMGYMQLAPKKTRAWTPPCPGHRPCAVSVSAQLPRLVLEVLLLQANIRLAPQPPKTHGDVLPLTAHRGRENGLIFCPSTRHPAPRNRPRVPHRMCGGGRRSEQPAGWQGEPRAASASLLAHNAPPCGRRPLSCRPPGVSTAKVAFGESSCLCCFLAVARRFHLLPPAPAGPALRTAPVPFSARLQHHGYKARGFGPWC